MMKRSAQNIQSITDEKSLPVSQLIEIHSTSIFMHAKPALGDVMKTFSTIKHQLYSNLNSDSVKTALIDLEELLSTADKCRRSRACNLLYAKTYYLIACCRFYLEAGNQEGVNLESHKKTINFMKKAIACGMEDRLHVATYLDQYHLRARHFFAIPTKNIIEDRDFHRKSACMLSHAEKVWDLLKSGAPEQAEKFLLDALDVDMSYTSTRLSSPR